MKILWGPFNHEKIDTYLLKHLSSAICKSFGPYGADYILPNDCHDLTLLPESDFDCVLLIKPNNRLVAPVIFQLDCPIIVCCSEPRGLQNIINLLDGIIPIMRTRLEFESFGKPIAQTILMIEQLAHLSPLSVQFPLACLGAVDSLLFETIESVYPDVNYFQGLPHDEKLKNLRHTQFALIADQQPNIMHFEALRTGAILLIPDDDSLIQALSLPADRFKTYDPLAPEKALKQLVSEPVAQTLSAYKIVPFANIIEEFLESIKSFDQSKQTLTPSQWQDYALNVKMHSTSKRSKKTTPKLNTNHALKQEIDVFSRSLAKDLWPDLLSYFGQTKEYRLSDIHAHVSVAPWHVGLRAGLARHVFTCSELSAIEKTNYLEQTLSLLRRSPAWVDFKPEILSEILTPFDGILSNQGGRPLVMLEGPVYSYISFARVNLPLLQAWKSSPNFDLLLAHRGQRSLTPEFPDLEFKGHPRLPDIVITHYNLHRETLPDFGKRIGIMPWDYGIAPKHMAQIINEECDEAWVPSQFCLDLYVRSGVDPKRLFMIPNGIDTQLYTDQGPKMDLPTTKSFKFCYVGSTIPRKGFDILLKTYLNTFTPDDDVCLVIKDFGGKDLHRSSSLYKQIVKASQDASKPAILLLDTDFMSEDDLTALYRACNVYVHPYRGEGFGMGILEAMACGLPAIIPDQGPAPEFCPLDVSWQVSGLTHFMMPSSIRKEHELHTFIDLPSFYHEPDEYFLAKAMREAFANPALCKQKGLVARQASLTYDWKQIAALAEERICRLINPELPIRLQIRANKSNSSVQENLSNSVVLRPDPEPHLVDFDLFHPFVQPQAIGRPYGILSITNWQSTQSSGFNHWQSLLIAYSHLEVRSAQTQLILVAQDLSSNQVKAAIQDFCQSQKIRFSSNLQIEVRDMPQTLSEIQSLYQKATLFVDTDVLSSGQWHLIAQAMGIRCLSTGQQVWLKHPYCEIAKSEDSLYLAWLLSKLLPSKQTIFDGLAVRAHLRSRYHCQQTDLTLYQIR